MPAPFHRNIAFNAHHSPMGAYFTFTCGHFGTRGGLGVQLGKPAGQDLFIGIKNGDRYAPVPLQVLPFFDGADQLDPRAAYTQQVPGTDPQRFAPYTKEQITREYGHATDRWKTPDFEFSIYTPFGSIPDPATAEASSLSDALLPAITAELIVDNRTDTSPKTAFFAINFHEGGTRILDVGLPPTHAGFALRAHLGVCAHVVDLTSKAFADSPARPLADSPTIPFAFLRWWPHEGLEGRSNPIHLLGTTPGVGIEVPPGKKFALRLALGCHLRDIVTTRLEGRYFYNRCYPTLTDVLNAASERFCDLKKAAKKLDEKLAASGLNPDQQFLIAHATRSYYANTELLEIDNEPYWIVNEGEYCMVNTLDLAVDQVFWELDQNPWVVRNLLDNFVKRYSYVDQVKIPTTEGTENTETTTEKNSVTSVCSVVQNVAPGGLSFCHDQGSHNQFSPFGHSAYELQDLTGCFSYMTQEQLCNWILIAASYVTKTNDAPWLEGSIETIKACGQSFLNRCAVSSSPGSMPQFLDSARCETGTEKTTYDSLDHSLAKASGNLYLVIKCWAASLGLEGLLALGEEYDLAWGPFRAAESISAIVVGLGESVRFLPSRIDLGSHDADVRILPMIESLVYIGYWFDNFGAFRATAKTETFVDWDQGLPFEKFIAALRTHTITLLADPNHRNHFSDGGIKLSSTSDNSWLSKIAIVQHVARSLFNLDENGNERPPNAAATGWEKSDAAHVTWLTTGPGAYWCASDQIVNGRAQGSRYYPRLITTALWLSE